MKWRSVLSVKISVMLRRFLFEFGEISDVELLDDNELEDISDDEWSGED